MSPSEIRTREDEVRLQILLYRLLYVKADTAVNARLPVRASATAILKSSSAFRVQFRAWRRSSSWSLIEHLALKSSRTDDCAAPLANDRRTVARGFRLTARSSPGSK
jgi:hypothetical protein